MGSNSGGARMGHTEPLQVQGLAKEWAEDQGDVAIPTTQGDNCKEERGQEGWGQAPIGPNGRKGCSTPTPICPGPHMGPPQSPS